MVINVSCAILFYRLIMIRSCKQQDDSYRLAMESFGYHWRNPRRVASTKSSSSTAAINESPHKIGAGQARGA